MPPGVFVIVVQTLLDVIARDLGHAQRGGTTR
jgi:hypothetical protein